VSREETASLDGDVIFLIYDENYSSSIRRAEFIRDPIWSQLKAVQQGRVFEVNSEIWAAGRSIQAAHQVLIDIASAFPERSRE
jgi:iron complex transport system substrate-binding protein